eukprot:scaffold160205_cov36-Tisochrysis_lutea.AAC.2
MQASVFGVEPRTRGFSVASSRDKRILVSKGIVVESTNLQLCAVMLKFDAIARMAPLSRFFWYRPVCTVTITPLVEAWTS